MKINLRLQKAQASIDLYNSLATKTKERKAINTKFRIVDKNSYLKDLIYHIISLFLPGNCHLPQTRPEWVAQRLQKKAKKLSVDEKQKLDSITATLKKIQPKIISFF